MVIPTLTPDLKKKLEKIIQLEDKWSPDEYNLELLADWPNDRLPIFVGIPTKRKVDYSPTYALLPDGSLISHHDKEGFKKILVQLSSSFGPNDAKFIAELTLRFVAFKYPVGRLWLNSLENKLPINKRPRPDSIPVLKQEKGAIIVEFYTYDYELLRLSDCRVKIKGSDYELDAKVLKK